MIKFLLLIFLFSCASSQDREVQISNSIETVELDGEKSQEKLVIENESLNRAYGPKFENNSTINESKIKIPGLFIGPGLYRSILGLEIYKKLVEADIRPRIFSGGGLGLVIASYLAAGKTTDQIEWFLFKLKKELTKLDAYSKNWIELLVAESSKFVKVKKIEYFANVLIVPLIDERTKQIKYIKKGSYEDLLRVNLSVNPLGGKYSSVLLSRYFTPGGLRESSANRLICINSIGDSIRIKRLNHYLLGVFNRLFNQIEKDRTLCDFVLGSKSVLNMDDEKNFSDFRIEGVKGIMPQLEYLKENYESKNL